MGGMFRGQYNTKPTWFWVCFIEEVNTKIIIMCVAYSPQQIHDPHWKFVYKFWVEKVSFLFYFKSLWMRVTEKLHEWTGRQGEICFCISVCRTAVPLLAVYMWKPQKVNFQETYEMNPYWIARKSCLTNRYKLPECHWCVKHVFIGWRLKKNLGKKSSPKLIASLK